jgi:hypothetical protein
VQLGIPSGDMSTLPGIRVDAPPWGPGWNKLAARLDAAGIPALTQAIVKHIHAHLDIYDEGKKITVPFAVGIDPNGRFLAPLHTHDASGVAHVESATEYDYTLGQFFEVWGVRLSSTCIGGLCNAGDKTLRIFVWGQPFTGDPTRIILDAHQEIVIAYGTQAQLPNPIPSSYKFAPGL